MSGSPAAKLPRRPEGELDEATLRALAPPQFTDPQLAALVAVVIAPTPWVGLRAIGRAHLPALGELAEAGVVVAWVADAAGNPLDEGPLYTLSPAGAARLGVKLDEEQEGRPVWLEAGRPMRPFRLRREGRETSIPYPELVIDPAPGPELLLDEESGQPVELFGRTVAIDHRIPPAEKRRASTGTTRPPRRKAGKVTAGRRKATTAAPGYASARPPRPVRSLAG